MNLTKSEIKQLDKEYIVGTYNRYDLAIDHGKGHDAFLLTAENTLISHQVSVLTVWDIAMKDGLVLLLLR